MVHGKKSLDPELANLPISDLLDRHPELITVINAKGMLCVGCLLAPFHNTHDAAREHDIDEKELEQDFAIAIENSGSKRA
jgi:hybrid cluster-associated redox disulfide protein